MKNLLAILLISGILFSCSNTPNNENNFTINATINSEDITGTAVLLKREAGEWITLDSSMVENKAFSFAGKIDMPEVFYINFKGQRGYAPVFAEAADIVVKIDMGNISNPEVTGSETHTIYKSYTDESDAYDRQLEDMWTQIKENQEAGNEEEAIKLKEQFDQIDAEKSDFVLQFAKENNSSVASAYIVLRNVYNYDETDLEPVVNAFDPSISTSSYVKTLSDRVETMKRTAVGQPAVDFTMVDPEGTPVALSSLYGSYLLVDFWASWCGPCRRENPNVVNAFNKYHEKGFDILGVSFDKDKEKWLKAVEDDKLTWSHVSDLKGWDNAAGKLYAISSIPANILLDPEGKIIAKNLREEDLHNKLAELLGE
jgi:peroxiredoxin